MYPTAFQGDALATLSRTMILGTFVGVVVSVVLAIVLSARRRSRNAPKKKVNHFSDLGE
jgi:ABC-type nitrate/sulfonate/bicarbonate transport system permease component